MRKTAATIVLAFGFVLLVAGAAFAVSKDLRPRPGQDLLCPRPGRAEELRGKAPLQLTGKPEKTGHVGARPAASQRRHLATLESSMHANHAGQNGRKMDPPGEDGENRRVRMELYTPG